MAAKRMIREYGSEYWTDNALGADLVPRDTGFVFEEGEILLASGRAAFTLLLEQADGLPDTALLPSYICESVSLPFVKKGIQILYYGTDKQMAPDLSEIISVITQRPVIFVHMGHFGFDTNAGIKTIIPMLYDKNCIVVEDITHTLFNTGERLPSQFRTASIRKWLGIPSGGVLFADSCAGQFSAKQEGFQDFYLPRLDAMKLKSNYLTGGKQSLKPEFLALFEKAETALKNDCGAYRIDAVSREILLQMSFSEIREKRRKNYTTLLKHFPGTRHVRPVFSELPAHTCPLFFPMYTDGRNRDYQRLFAEKGLYTAIHWPENGYDPHSGGDLEYIQQHILSLPCDQRYDCYDMLAVLDIMMQCLSEV